MDSDIVSNRDQMLWLTIGLFTVGVLAAQLANDPVVGSLLLYGSAATWVCFARCNSWHMDWPISVEPGWRVATYALAPLALLVAPLIWFFRWFSMAGVITMVTVWSFAAKSPDPLDGLREYGDLTRYGALYVLIPVIMLTCGVYALAS